MTEDQFAQLKRGDIIRLASGASWIVDRVESNGDVTVVRTMTASNPSEWERVYP